MKTITLRIGNMVNGPSPAYPVELEVDQQVTRAAIPADEVDVKRQALVQDPGVWGGRELGGEDPDGNGPRPNNEFAGWLHELVFSGDLAASWRQLTETTGFRLILDIEPRELLQFRWEQMGSYPIFPAMCPNCSLVRGKIRRDATIPTRDAPIKMLVVVGSEPRDPDVMAEEGERSISFGSRGDPCCSRKCLPLKMIPASRLVVRT